MTKREQKTAKSKERMIDALYETAFVVKEAVALAGLKSRNTYYKWLNEDEEFAQRVDEAFEDMLDRVQRSLFRNALSGNFQAQKFILERKGKHRGWGADTLELSDGIFTVQIGEPTQRNTIEPAD